MQLDVRTAPAETDTRRSNMTPLLLTAVTALALTVAAGVATWHAAGGRTSTKTSAAARQIDPTMPLHTEAAGVVQAPSTAAMTAVPVLYLAASQEQAVFIRRFAGELDELRAQSGQPR